MFATAENRPKRKHIPMRVRRAVVKRQGKECGCGCGAPVYAERGKGTHFDHCPALGLRKINRTLTDFIPPQLAAKYIVARTAKCHDKKTRGTGATTAGTDIGMMTKNRRRDRKRSKPKPRWASRPIKSGNGFPPKGSRPMGKKK